MADQPQDEDFSYKEHGIIYEAQLMENQLRNFRVVLNQPMPKKKEGKLLKQLSGHVMRNQNAQSALTKLMKQKGYVRK